MRNLFRGDRSNIMPNLRTVGLVFDTFPGGWPAGWLAGQAVWWRMDNSASSGQAELEFPWVCLSLAICLQESLLSKYFVDARITIKFSFVYLVINFVNWKS